MIRHAWKEKNKVTRVYLPHFLGIQESVDITSFLSKARQRWLSSRGDQSHVDSETSSDEGLVNNA